MRDYNVICDRCGRKRWKSDTRLNWENLLVCADTCWEPRHPQDFVKGTADDQTVPIPRPDVPQTSGETTLASAAARNATTIELSSASQAAEDDPIGIILDNGAEHWTFIDGLSGTTVTLGSYLPHSAAAGNAVYLPGTNNEMWAT